MTKKDKQSISTALLCICLFALALIVGARAGWVSAERHMQPITDHSECVPDYDPLEVIIEHEYIYNPLPVDYEVYDGDISETDAVLIAKTMYGEYRNADNYEQASMVAWCILNRVDSELYPNCIKDVVQQSGQFHGYSEKNPVDADLYAIAEEVLAVWNAEKLHDRTLPKEFLYFTGDGNINHYRTQDGTRLEDLK